MRNGHCAMNLSREEFRRWFLEDQGTQGSAAGNEFRRYKDRDSGFSYWAHNNGHEDLRGYHKPVAMQNEVQKMCVIAFIVTSQTSW